VQYTEVVERLAEFHHPLLKQLRFVDSYQGKQIPDNQRSLTVHTVCGDDTRTLVEHDMNAYRNDFERHLTECGYEIRR
jgi:phenylalanyl-tRNA synthetase beta subunit